jgi:hypothetical protein
MRPCSRASADRGTSIMLMARPTGVSDPGYSHSALTSWTGPWERSRTSSRRRLRSGCRCRPWRGSNRGCRCNTGRSCWRRSSSWRYTWCRRRSSGRCGCRCRRRSTGWENTHVIDVLFMPPDGVRVDVVSSRIRHVASGIVRNNRNVIAYLLILRETCLRIKRIAGRHIGSPRHATISAAGIE